MSIQKPGFRLGVKRPLLVAIAAASAANTYAYNFEIGPVEAQLDSNFSIGTSWRLEDPSSDLVSKFNGGSKNSANYDDGNLNFEKGDQIATVLKGNHDFELKHNNFGAFFRGKYWYDFVAKDNDLNKTDGSTSDRNGQLSKEASDRIGDGGKLLDAFIYGDFFIGDKPLSVRWGRQVISWGESLFIQGGINIINPFDVTAFRAPGAEIKEGFLPTQKVYFNFGATDNISIEGYVDYDWKKTEIDPCGSFWGPADFAGKGCDYAVATTGEHLIDNPGANKALLRAYQQANIDLQTAVNSGDETAITAAKANLSDAGFEAVEAITGTAGIGGLLGLRGAPAPDGETPAEREARLEANRAISGLASNLRIVQRLGDEKPDDDELQYGISMRWFVPQFNNTEFGFYYINYHSKLPFLSPKLTTTEFIATGFTVGNTTTSTVGYADPRSPYTGYVETDADGNPTGDITGVSQQSVVFPAAQGYRFIYPESIDLFGLSFATSIESGFFQGLAIAGEWSYRPDAPVQQSLGVFLNRGLYTTSNAAVDGDGALRWDADGDGTVSAAEGPCATDDSCNPFLEGGELVPYSEMQMHQIQVNFLYSWPEVWGASQAILASEIGMVWLPDLEDYDGNPVFNTDGSLKRDTDELGLDVSAQTELFVTDTSYGIRNRAALIYNNVFAGVNLIPQMSLNYDIDGYAPGPGAAFVEGSTALGFSLTASYLNKYSASLSITKFYGTDEADERVDTDFDGIVDTTTKQTINKVHDRDFASLSFRVSL